MDSFKVIAFGLCGNWSLKTENRILIKNTLYQCNTESNVRYLGNMHVNWSHLTEISIFTQIRTFALKH